MFCTRRISNPQAATLSHIILVLFIICSIVHAQLPPAPNIEVSKPVIKQLDKDYPGNTTASDNITTKTVTIVLEAQKTHDPNDNDSSDSSDNSWQNGGHVNPYMVATDGPTATVRPGDTAAPDSVTAPTDAPNGDATDDSVINQDQSTVRRMTLISSIVGTIGFVSLLAVASLLYVRKRERKRLEKLRQGDIELRDQPRAGGGGGGDNHNSTSSNGHQPAPMPFISPEDTQSLTDSQPSAPMLAPIPLAHGSGNNTLRRHYLEIPQVSSASMSPTRNMHTLAHTQAIPPPSAPTAKEIHAEDENLHHLVRNDYSSSTAGQQSSSRRFPSFRDDASITSSQEAPPAYSPSAPPLYFLADFTESTSTGTSRPR